MILWSKYFFSLYSNYYFLYIFVFPSQIVFILISHLFTLIKYQNSQLFGHLYSFFLNFKMESQHKSTKMSSNLFFFIPNYVVYILFLLHPLVYFRSNFVKEIWNPFSFNRKKKYFLPISFHFIIFFFFSVDLF